MHNLAAIKIAFDLDGALVDSAPGLASALGQVIQLYNTTDNTDPLYPQVKQTIGVLMA